MGDTFEMPQLEQTDVQGFIAAFNSSKPREEKKDRGAQPSPPTSKEETLSTLPPSTNDEIIRLRNVHELEIILQQDISGSQSILQALKVDIYQSRSAISWLPLGKHIARTKPGANISKKVITNPSCYLMSD